MPNVNYVAPDGATTAIDVPAGWSVMEGAVKHGVAGILAECGGACACATCHVFVDPAWVGRLPPREAGEHDLLECTAVERRPNSRLSCQIRVSAELDGLVVHLPERQA